MNRITRDFHDRLSGNGYVPGSQQALVVARSMANDLLGKSGCRIKKPHHKLGQIGIVERTGSECHLQVSKRIITIDLARARRELKRLKSLKILGANKPSAFKVSYVLRAKKESGEQVTDFNQALDMLVSNQTDHCKSLIQSARQSRLAA